MYRKYEVQTNISYDSSDGLFVTLKDCRYLFQLSVKDVVYYYYINCSTVQQKRRSVCHFTQMSFCILFTTGTNKCNFPFSILNIYMHQIKLNKCILQISFAQINLETKMKADCIFSYIQSNCWYPLITKCADAMKTINQVC